MNKHAKKTQDLLTYFNPFSTPLELGIKPSDPYASVKKAAGVSTAFALAALGLKGVGDLLSTMEQEKADKKLRANIQARYSVLSPDPELDTDKEKEEEEAGLVESEFTQDIPLHKTAADPVSYFTSKDVPVYDFPLTLAAIAGGSLAGTALYDLLRSRIEKARLEKSIKERKDNIDSLFSSEYAELRGIPTDSSTLAKTAAYDPNINVLDEYNPFRNVPPIFSDSTQKSAPSVSSIVADATSKAVNSAADTVQGIITQTAAATADKIKSANDRTTGDQNSLLENIIRGSSKTYAATSALTMAAAFFLTKSYLEKKDKNRENQKQFEQILSERAKLTNKPTLLIDAGTFKVPGMDPKKKKEALKQIQALGPATSDPGTVASLNAQVGNSVSI